MTSCFLTLNLVMNLQHGTARVTMTGSCLDLTSSLTGWHNTAYSIIGLEKERARSGSGSGRASLTRPVGQV
jgi:hypothetical protein